jgi:O-succinylbenzoate synthase
MHENFVVKDSGVRQEYDSGMRRDTQEGKPDYTLIHNQFLTRLAIHLGKGAIKYGRDNWMCANSEEELQRFKSSAMRHLMQWLNGDVDEDHMAAVCFNLMCAEYVKERLKNVA